MDSGNYLTPLALAKCDFRDLKNDLGKRTFFFCSERKRGILGRWRGGMVLSSQAHAFSEVLQKVLRQAIIKWVSVSRSHMQCLGQDSLWGKKTHTPHHSILLSYPLSSFLFCCPSFSYSHFLSPLSFPPFLSSLLLGPPPPVSFLKGQTVVCR